MRGIILAAGRGSRLNQFTEDKPKCFNEVDGKPLIDWQIEALSKGGIDEIIIVTGYLNHIIEAKGFSTRHNPRWEHTNMVRSLLAASDLFDRPMLISYADLIYNHSIVNRLSLSGGDFVIAYDRKWLELWERRFEDPLSDAESFMLDTEGNITEIGSHVDKIEDIQGQYMGLMKFSPTGLKIIESMVCSLEECVADKLDMTGILNMLIKQGHKLGGMPVEGGWCEIDTASDLMLANQMCFEGHFKD